MIKAIFIDIDGTLTNSRGKITERTKIVCIFATIVINNCIYQLWMLDKLKELLNVESGGQVLDINLQSKTQSPYS